MAAEDAQQPRGADELVEIIRAIKERVRGRATGAASGGDGEQFSVQTPDLMLAVHARDAALGKVAAIGTVNPRRGGPLNALIQQAKRIISRALDWHVREQVEFNRAAVASLDGLIEAFDDCNRALSQLTARINAVGREAGDAHAQIAAGLDELKQEVGDTRAHWNTWRSEWEQRLLDTETRFLRGIAEAQGGYEHKLRQVHRDYEASLWGHLDKMRAEYERLIHTELRALRQRIAASAPVSLRRASETQEEAGREPYDALRFALRFRGTEEYVKQQQRHYVPLFAGCDEVLDLGCGRGEFLEVMREAGIKAYGVDLNEECVALCADKGLRADKADLFAHLEGRLDSSLGGIFCAQVVEHLPPLRIPELVRLAAAKLHRGGLLVVETPNPECLAIFATHFYLDPTHVRPVPAALLSFYMEEAGLGRIRISQVGPAVEFMPALTALPSEVRDAFFNGLDYYIAGYKL